MADDHAEAELEGRLDAWAAAQTSELRPDFDNELSGTLRASLQPVKPLPSNRALVIRFLLTFLAFAGGLIAILDKAGVRMMTAPQIAGMAAILTSGAVFFALQLVGRMVPGNRITLPFFYGLTLFLLGVGAAMAFLFPWWAPRAFVAEGWPCSVLELAIGGPAAGVFWLMARRGALFPSAELTVALSGLAVCLALVADQTQCMFPQAPHLLVWHGGIAVVLIAAGFLMSGAVSLGKH